MTKSRPRLGLVRSAPILIVLVAALFSPSRSAFAQQANLRSEFADDRFPTSTLHTVSVQETTYRQEWSTEMIETPVKRWVAVPTQTTEMQLPAVPHPRAGRAPWLVNVPAVEWKLVEDKVRTPVTTSRIVPETRTVQKEVRMLAFEPGARALASTASLQPIPGANVLADAGSPRVAANTTIPSTTVPAAPSSNASSSPSPPVGASPVGGTGGFPSGPFPANPWVTPLQPVPSPTPWTAGAVGPNPQWGGLQRIDGDLPTGSLGAAGGLR